MSGAEGPLTDSSGADRHYIVAAEGIAKYTCVLKQDECFAILSRNGDIDPVGRSEEGLYYQGTRFLSQWTLRLAGHRPLLLGSNVRRDNLLQAVDLTNPDLYANGRLILPRGAMHIHRSKWLWAGVCYERIRVRNFSLSTFTFELDVSFGSDYADIFEVRGERRARRGQLLPQQLQHAAAELAYVGLDGRERRTRIQCAPPPRRCEEGRLHFQFSLGSRGEQTIEIAVICAPGGQVLPHEEAWSLAQRALKREEILDCRISTSNEEFNGWLRASTADLGMLLTATPHGLYPFAGLPWFDAPFGRDGVITALETLWLWPNLARGVLSYLAATQAKEADPERDAEPGKILHEARTGEMAALREIPFGRYYGSVDSTPLFVMLAGAYFRRTGDVAFMDALWPNLLAALEWIDRYGDRDEDGFVEYARHSPDGLVHQGWKDSQDSVFHADGSLAEAPIALCEVQAYVYAGRLAAADVAAALGHSELARRLREQAGALRKRFEERFWCEDLGIYCLALDAHKQPCRVLTSNAGHCLFAGIASDERARRLVAQFSSRRFFSGWGVRTVAEGQPRYNPMGYHNGSIWPHDNALLAAGAARYRTKLPAMKLLAAHFEASTYFEQHRLPELFCGFPRRRGEAPTAYPVACSPQAWAAGAVFMLLNACLGVKVDARSRRLLFHSPVLPRFLDRVTIEDLRIGDVRVDVTLHRYASSVGVDVRRRGGRIDVVVET